MRNHRSLLVPLDGSPLAELALAPAMRLAMRDGAELHLVRAHQTVLSEDTVGGAEWEGWVREEERQYLETAAQRARDAGVSRVVTALLGEPVATAICAHTHRVGADRIVMATHGRTGFSRVWFGSVADAVVRHASVPVLMVRAMENARGRSQPVRRVLVPLDGSSSAEAIIPHALALAGPDRAEFILVRVVAPVHVPAPSFAYAGGDVAPDAELIDQLVASAESYVHEVVARLRQGNESLEVEAIVHVNSQPAAAILRVADAQDVDLIAMSTHGRGGTRLIVGSVADKILRGTSSSLLVCRA